MKRKLFLLALLPLLVGCNSQTPLKEVITLEDQYFSLIPQEMASYLTASTSQEQFLALLNHSNNKANRQDYAKKVLVNIPCEEESNHRIIYSSKDGKVIKEVTTNYFEIDNPIPGYCYEYEIYSSNSQLKEYVGKAYIKNDTNLTVRYINVDNVSNVRDLGGWPTSSGHTVKYGLLYRGGELNATHKLNESGKNKLKNELGIKLEIDLRNDGDAKGQKCPVFGDISFGGYDVSYYRDSSAFSYYDDVVKNENSKKILRNIFSKLGDINSYPSYFHCVAGADRTGTLAALILGSLGVSEEDIIRDYELTSFSTEGNRWRAAANEGETDFDFSNNDISSGTEARIMNLLNDIKNKDDSIGNLQDKFIDTLVTDCGIDIDDIHKMQVIMLGLTRDTNSNSHVQETCTTGGIAIYPYDLKQLVINTDPIGHKYIRQGGVAVCEHCNDTILVKEGQMDIKNGYHFFKEVATVTDMNNHVYEVNSRDFMLEKEYAYKDNVPFVINYKDGEKEYLILQIYSLFIGSEEELFDINKYSYDLVDIDNNVSTYGYYLLTNDVVLTKDWEKKYSLGLSSTKTIHTGFKGIFDGNNKTISNFNCVDKDASLVYIMANEGIIKNLTINGSSTNSSEGSDFIASYTYGGSFINLNINCDLNSGSPIFNSSALLGVIGYLNNIEDEIIIDNVTISGNNTDISYGFAIGLFYMNDINNIFTNYNLLKVTNSKISGFSNLYGYYSQKDSNYMSYLASNASGNIFNGFVVE